MSLLVDGAEISGRVAAGPGLWVWTVYAHKFRENWTETPTEIKHFATGMKAPVPVILEDIKSMLKKFAKS